MSICTLVKYEGQLKGVICIDEAFNEILATLNYYQQGQISYPFLLDETTKIIQHPILPVHLHGQTWKTRQNYKFSSILIKLGDNS